MKCPACGKEMEQGFLQSGNRIAWTKKIHRISLLPKEGEILLENNMISQAIFDAYICKSCKKITIDYSDKKIQEK
jgi:DNA-directed RNA polymerase subunit RPC12/RpoP